MIYFKELLIQARKSKHMLKKEAAAYFGWTPMYYGRYESGCLLPGKGNIKKFSQFIEIDVDELWKIVEESRRLTLC